MASPLVVLSGEGGTELGEELAPVVLRADLASAEETLAALVPLKPAVIVVDFARLGDAGFQLMTALADDERTRNTTVLALVQPQREAIEFAIRYGADDFITTDQGTHPSTLARVARHIHQAAVASRLETTSHRSPSDRPSDQHDLALVRHAAERRIKRFQPYVEFFKNSADGMVVIDPNGKILFANPRARSIFPLTTLNHQANVLDFIHEDEHDHARDIARGFSHGRFPKNVDFHVVAGGKDTIINVNFSATLRGESAVLFTFRDVTKERAIEQELTKAREFLERVIDSSLDAIVASDLHGNVRLFNRAAAQIFGYSPDQVVGVMNVERLYPPGVARQVMKMIRDDSHGGFGRLEGHAVDMLDSRGNRIPVLISAGLIFENGHPSGTVGVFRDVREERRMVARLEEAEAAVRGHERGAAVAQLAGATAHELNQPLTVMIAYSDMLRLKLDADSPLHDIVEVISKQAERMAEIVRQVGRITRYETMSYVGSAQILDLEKSSRPDSER